MAKTIQAWTQLALARAARACPDRDLRLNLRTGVVELIAPDRPQTGSTAAHEQHNDTTREQHNDTMERTA